MRCLLALLVLAGFTLPAAAAVRDEAILQPSPPQTLSAFGFFDDLPGGMPAAGVVPYRLNTELFSDYAAKSRFVYVPKGTAAAYREEEAFDFPVGAALIKTFAFPADLRDAGAPARIIETRVLVRQEAGWKAYPYVWRADGSDADLKVAGAKVRVTFIDAKGTARETVHAVPNVNQCKGCHNVAGALAPIGPKARSLNGDYAYATGTDNQLAHWGAAGILKGAPAPAAAPRMPRFDEPGDGTLEARARAYLDINCAHCHSQNGPANTTGLFLDFNEDRPVHWGYEKRPVAAGRGSLGMAFAIEPGHPERSFLLGRMKSSDPGVMMPELGRTLVHEEGAAVIEAWIASMK